MAMLLDSYSETNVNDEFNLEINSPFVAVGQSFKTPDDETVWALSSAKFYLKKLDSPTGNLVAKLYEHSGSFGAGGVPTGSALAVSSPVDSSSLSSSIALVEFVFDESFGMSPNTEYVIVVDGSAVSGLVKFGSDSSFPTAQGNACYFASGTWYSDSRDCAFYVYGVEYIPPFEPRRLVNKAGFVFDPEKTYILYAEDFNNVLDRLDALEAE